MLRLFFFFFDPTSLKDMPHLPTTTVVHYGSDCQMFPHLLSIQILGGELMGRRIKNHTVKKKSKCGFMREKEG